MENSCNDKDNREAELKEIREKLRMETARRRRAEETLKLLQGLSDKILQEPGDIGQKTWTRYVPSYGNLSKFNTDRTILDAVGSDILAEIVNDYLFMLKTSAAIFERNGDYALGIFGSSWCRFLDQASFALCGTDLPDFALACGKWLCHESCWSRAARISIESGGPTDIECEGGIRIYAVPIFAGEKIVGSINLGYGDPPRDPAKLRELAEKYQVSPEQLAQHAEAYVTRPQFLIDLAKKRLHGSARLIGEMVQHKQARDALAREKAELRATLYGIGDAVISTGIDGRVARMNPAAERMTGWAEKEALGKPLEQVFRIVNEQTRRPVDNPVKEVLREGVTGGLANHTLLISKDGKEIPIKDSGAPIFDSLENITGVVLVFRDQSEERLAKRITETRLSLIEYAAGRSLDEFLSRALDEVGGFVDSPIGFYHFVSSDQKSVSLQQWSTRTLREFCRADARGFHYSIDKAGVWVDCVHEKKPVIHNDYARLSHKKGMPEGHAEVVRELVVPVMRSDKVVAILGVGNKPEDYTEKDVKIVSFMADVTWEIVRQKRAEETLRKSEEKYRLLFDNAEVLVSVYDRDGVCRLMNRKVASCFGGVPEDFIGKSFYELHPPAAEEYTRRIREAIQSGVSRGYEDRVDFPSGVRWLLSTVHPLPDARGDHRVQIISQDITERKQAEMALLKERDMAQKYLDIAGVMFVAINAEGKVALINRKGSDVLGYEQAEVLGRNWFENFLPANIRDRVKTVFESLMAGKIEPVEYFENPVLTRDGGERIIAWHNTELRGNDGDIIGILGSGEDITERKQAEMALKESQERFRLLVEAAPMPISLVQKGKFIFGNPETARMLGYESPEELVGKPVLEVIAPEFHQIVRDRIKRLETGTKNPPMEIRLIKADGGAVWNIITSVPVRIDRESTAIVVGQDITERKLAEEEKARLETQFHQAQKLESIGRLAGGVAHDLNNLLSPILGYGEMLIEDASAGDPSREALKEIVGAGMRARDLVQRLLAFSRKQTLEFKSIDLNRLIENFKQLLHRTIREDIAIKMFLDRSLPPVKGDVGQLEQVLMNLAVNAQDAMPDGGRLTITTSRVELDEEYARQRQGVVPGEYVLLEVSDTGVGIDANIHDHLFEPFFTTKENMRGTGLGLATVYGIVKQHGGNVWAYSEPGLGATFKVYLPAFPEAENLMKKSSKTASSPQLQGSETILLVEDNDPVRKLALTILKRRGYTVLEAESGKEALEILERHQGPLDLLLTDVVMPEMNGKELFKQVLSAYPNIRALFMSGYTDNVIAHRGIMDEGVNFIQKPFSIEVLAQKVREVLDKTLEI